METNATSGLTTRNDGTVKTATDVLSFRPSSQLTFGASNVSYLTEVSRGALHARSLPLDTLDVSTVLSGVTLQNAAGQGRPKGAAIILARADKARADQVLGNASTYTFNITFDALGKTSTIRFAGPFRASSPCGSGMISTPREDFDGALIRRSMFRPEQLLPA